MTESQVRWFEQGQLEWDGRQLEVYRELRVVPDGDGWLVCFVDGRPFHPWIPGQSVQHQCRADLYRGVVAVDEDQRRLRMLWDVTGPAKDQRIASRCWRL